MVKCDQTDMVFTAYITLRNGNRLYAKQVGKKVFCFPRKEAKEKNDKKIGYFFAIKQGTFLL